MGLPPKLQSWHWIRWPQDVAVCKHGPATIAQLHQSLSQMAFAPPTDSIYLWPPCLRIQVRARWDVGVFAELSSWCELIDLTSRSFRFTSGASLVASNVYHMDSSIAWLSVVLEGPRFSGWTNPSFQWLLWLSRDDCEYQWLLYNSLLIDDMGFYTIHYIDLYRRFSESMSWEMLFSFEKPLIWGRVA